MPSADPPTVLVGPSEHDRACAISDLALDLIIETLIGTVDAHQRALIVHDLVQEIMAVVSWLGSDELGGELIGLRNVLAATCEHRQRMQSDGRQDQTG